MVHVVVVAEHFTASLKEPCNAFVDRLQKLLPLRRRRTRLLPPRRRFKAALCASSFCIVCGSLVC